MLTLRYRSPCVSLRNSIRWWRRVAQHSGEWIPSGTWSCRRIYEARSAALAAEPFVPRRTYIMYRHVLLSSISASGALCWFSFLSLPRNNFFFFFFFIRGSSQVDNLHAKNYARDDNIKQGLICAAFQGRDEVRLCLEKICRNDLYSLK